MQGKGIVILIWISESGWVMRNRRRIKMNSPWSSSLNLIVDEAGKPPLQGESIWSNPMLYKRMIYHEIEWYRVRIHLSSL